MKRTLVVFFALSLAACGEDSDSRNNDEEITNAGDAGMDQSTENSAQPDMGTDENLVPVLVVLPSDKLLRPGQSWQFRWELQNASAPDTEPTWESSDESVLTIDASTGFATANAFGSANVTATLGELTATAEVIVLGEFVTVAAGRLHTCANTTDGLVFCWGDNSRKQVGQTDDDWVTSPAVVEGIQGVSSLTSGADHACAISGGSVYCWGSNTFGELGDGTTDDSARPIEVEPPAEKFISVGAGEGFTCALDEAFTLYCWGKNSSGQLGNGGVTARTPSEVSGGHMWQIFRIGGNHVCGRTFASGTQCWGDNGNLQLGPASMNASEDEPVRLTLNITNFGLGVTHTCGSVAGTPQCWGASAGLGSSTSRSDVPLDVDTEQTFSDFQLGDDHTCGVTMLGNLMCWGANGDGQLGDNTEEDRITPVDVLGMPSFDALSVGWRHACGVNSTGDLYCWGSNSWGQLGDGTQDDRRRPTLIDLSL